MIVQTVLPIQISGIHYLNQSKIIQTLTHITIADNSNGTATFSLTSSVTGEDSKNGVISTTGSPSSFPSFVQTAGGVDQIWFC